MKHADIVAKALVVDPGGKVLLLRRSKDDQRRPLQWDFAGGTVEDDEDFTAAIAREIKEEAGLNIGHHDIHLSFTETNVKEGKKPLCYLLFVAYADQTDVTLSFEHDKYQWVTLDEAIEIYEHPRHNRFMRYVRDNQILAS